MKTTLEHTTYFAAWCATLPAMGKIAGDSPPEHLACHHNSLKTMLQSGQPSSVVEFWAGHLYSHGQDIYFRVSGEELKTIREASNQWGWQNVLEFFQQQYQHKGPLHSIVPANIFSRLKSALLKETELT